MRRRLWLLPGTVLGAWAAVLWQQYVVDVGCSLGWRSEDIGWQANGVLLTASAVAIGAGVLAIVHVLTRPPQRARIASARVAHRYAIAGGSLALACIVAALAVSDRLIPRGACALEARNRAVL